MKAVIQGTVLGTVLSLFSIAAWGQIFQWVDANGQTHFASQPPIGVNARQLHHQRDGSLESWAMAEKKDSREDQGHSHTPALNCPAAIAHLRSSLPFVDYVVEQAHRRADLSDAVYRQARQRAKVLRSRISTARCEASKGKLRSFYACLDHSDDYRAVFSCNHTQAYERQLQDWSQVAKRPILQKVLWGIIEGEDIKKPQ